MRIDQRLAEKWISPNSSVLDLGCGDGELLAHMSKQHNIRAYGLEIDQEKIAIAISRGLNIIQQDLNLGLSRFADQSFDSVVMAQALQAVDAPDVLLRDMVRVGKQAIITFPNFAYWKTRSFLALKGKMPVSEALPYMWYNTPNIHLCTFRDLKPYVQKTELKLLIDLPLMVTNKVVC
jgi:methionine biosynthesis protein MetW